MDLNQLYFDHQLLLMNANGARSAGGRRGHETAANGVAARIGCFQRALEAPAATAWLALALPSARVPAL